MKRVQTPASTSAALILLLLLALSGSKNYVEGRPMMKMLPVSMDLGSSQALRDLQISKKMKEEFFRGEKGSFRRIPRSGSSPIQNRNKPSRSIGGSRKQQTTATEP